MTPMALGLIPFGVAVGATIAASSLSTGAAVASGPLIPAGAAQVATLQMLEAGSSPVVIVFSALLINLRILLYSTSLAPWFSGLPLRRRLLLAIPVIDQTHFLCAARFSRGDLDQEGRAAYHLAAGAWLIVVWLGSQLATVILGAGLPDSARLHMAAPLALVGLLAKSITTGPARVAAAVAIAATAVAPGLPFHSTILVATLVAIAVAVRVEAALPAPQEEGS